MRYGLRITSFDGSIGMHHYIKGWRFDPSQTDRVKRLAEERVTFNLTIEQAKFLNEKDSSSHLGLFGNGHRAGEVSDRFSDKREGIERGIALLREKYGDDIIIEEGDHIDCESPILWPK